ncbi:MAG: holo-[acyl-carrier-protein] synthase [Candidatus Omnitrophica bacterium CG1_02_49_10]|nr:MAG: holo-[acyl-carrier-protein] synthase [Candidatus Omnitrophica bacterium CG1_02_49_10]
MIDGLGVDIVEIRRFKRILKRSGDAFLNRVFTKGEIEYSGSKRAPYLHLAGRFAVKEAVLKAIGDGNIAKIRLKEIEVENNRDGKPSVRFHGDAAKIKRRNGIKDVLVSISHTENYAVANAILIKNGR